MVMMMKHCVLEDKECNACGRCDDRCELDPRKLCDNCFRCLDTDAQPYAHIRINGIYVEDDFLQERSEARSRARVQLLYGLQGRLRR